jgi:hypothetical protein
MNRVEITLKPELDSHFSQQNKAGCPYFLHALGTMH